MLFAWYGRYSHRIKPKRRRMTFWTQVDSLQVLIDESMRGGEYDGMIYWGRPTVIHVAPDPDISYQDLLLHEAAHFVAIWRWRDCGHGRRFKQCVQELTLAVGRRE